MVNKWIKNNKFDLIYSHQVFEHIDNLNEIVEIKSSIPTQRIRSV